MKKTQSEAASRPTNLNLNKTAQKGIKPKKGN